MESPTFTEMAVAPVGAETRLNGREPGASLACTSSGGIRATALRVTIARSPAFRRKRQTQIHSVMPNASATMIKRL